MPSIHNKLIRKKQKGASLLFTLIGILVLMSAAAISLRNTQTQQSNAGNFAVRQEMIQHAEWVIAKILEHKDDLPSATATDLHLANNYSPHITATNNQGIPLALLGSETDFASKYGTKNYQPSSAPHIKLRHFIERMCEPGTPNESQRPTGCVTTNSHSSSASDNQPATLSPIPSVIYRISLRVDGPRNTQVFIQSSFTRDTSF